MLNLYNYLAKPSSQKFASQTQKITLTLLLRVIACKMIKIAYSSVAALQIFSSCISF